MPHILSMKTTLFLLFVFSACGEKTNEPAHVTQEGTAAVNLKKDEPALPTKPSALSPVSENATYQVKLEGPSSFAAGKLAQLRLSLTGKGEYHLNQDYPTKVNVTAPAPLSFPKSSLEKADAAEFTEPRARFDIPFTPSAAGEHEVKANVSFAVCTAENCVPEECTVALKVNVSEPGT